ncbi:[protein-PII] uridylyltransferase [Methylotenera sp.]|uniref:[protein-PII] uridylyltransferase n=1 Tax=Methylotenera sp. TaxID=2051956 RepID=UPI002486D700|nr:[protein-PII] uridylyltransferase [Methylotenera sp.]MDI1299624.1 [protein-PII] uridylyltransferase [Methylotenera sp.]
MLLDDLNSQVNTGSQPEKNNIATLRQYLKDGFVALKTDFLKAPNNTRLFKQHCKLIDRLLLNIWEQANIDKRCCLIAVGGYGRGELYPYSDIDLLILLPESDDLQASAGINAKLETLVGLLWDIGLNVAHSVRSLSECIHEAEKDITVQTNLIESRLITGEAHFYKEFLDEINQTFSSPAAIANFFAAKVKEQNNRHAKFNDTAYNLEPNIKESPGGLRDLHMILWVAQSLNMTSVRPSAANSTWALLTKQNIISALEARQIQQHQSNLQLLRIRLHFISKRREDRLLFDFQNELADSLGYVNTPRKRASEQLMQSYYRSVKFVSLMNEVLLKSFQQIISINPPIIKSINAHFESHDQLLEAKTAGLLQQEPSAIFEAFLLLQQHPELDGMGATLLRNMQRVKRLVNRDFRQNPVNKKLFIDIISQPSGVNHALRAMNRYGILGSYIPAFGKIIGQMQHDLFHVYTVDEHILNVLANLRRFAKPELKHEFPLCSRLFAEFDAPHLLYLAALFHDIAKGRGGDHSTLGTVDAIKFCKLHGLSKADSTFVAWLVAAHLQMSSTAQKSDLSDPSVIETFSRFVQNERRLVALYLLTVADIRGTSPLVWNAWKARLLESLFNATKHALANQLLYVQQAITTRKSEAAERLNKFGLSRHSYEHLWEKFGSNYFIRHESDEIAWHSRLLTPHLNTTHAIVRARLSPSGDGIQVMIYSKDQNDLFARICNFFDRMAYNIVEAKIYTTDHAYALDSFIVLDQSGKSVSYSGLLKFIEVELAQKLDKTQPLESPLKGRISRQVKHMPILAQVTITQEADNNNHKLEIIANDRTGLLATLAHQFLVLEVELHNAKINTLGNRAEDIFLISANKGQKLDALRIIALKEAIISEI